jgi:hypothetical protein
MCRRLIFFPLKVLLVLAAVVGVIFLFRDVIVERLAAHALSSGLGAAQSYAIRITNTSVLDLLRGNVREAWLTARGVRGKKGPAIDYLQVHARGVEFDTSKVKKVGEATFTATLIEEDLRDYINTAAPEGIRPDITIRKGGLVLKVRKDILGILVPAEVTGTLQIKDKHLLIFLPKKAEILKIGLPGDTVKSLFAKINPLLDSAQLKHPLVLDRVECEDGSVALKGRIRFVTPIVFRR